MKKIMNLTSNGLLFLLLCILVSTVTKAANTTDKAVADKTAVKSDSYPQNIKNITAITESFGVGQKLTAVVIEYDKNINSSKLNKDSYTVKNRTITNVYSSDKPEKSVNKNNKNGKYVVIELSENDTDATLYKNMQKTEFSSIDKEKIEYYKESASFPTVLVILKPEVTVTQVKDITASNGQTIKAANTEMKNNKTRDLIVEDFKQFEYKDEKTGQTIKYNLYIPKNYNKNKKYPMVLFMHDASLLTDYTKTTLLQGNGATIWATPEEQSKHEAFVVAPQYSVQVVNDNAEYTQDLPATVNLIRDYLIKEYSIDTDRLYTTGQSMGGMMSIVMNFQHPDLFAASYFVASQWNPTVTAPMAKNKMWTVVSTADSKAFPTWQKILPILEANGGKIATNGENYWNGKSTVAQFNGLVAEILKKNPDVNIYFTPIEKGTLPALQVGNPGSEHMATWKTAYYIEGIRDWLFKQKK